ncbi:uncharacterized protein LOC123021979 [Varanus komodoensis]|uniref:uncharacterized protein LOC123021979 n=1 Tax=Varanus komodoensis TaxID=61221 RepID=UPI001CF7A325|nr:uncharacterized protein LOC123021979 [Varanus komodoensis]
MEGELCRGWTYAAFRCPQLHDGADTKFCCGTCSAPYCCSSEDARLDQLQCIGLGYQTAVPSGTQQPEPTQPPPKQDEASWPAILTLVVLFTWGLMWIAFTCLNERYWHMPGSLWVWNAPNAGGPENIELDFAGSPLPSCMGPPPPPYEMPPPYSAEDPGPFNVELEPFSGEPAPPYSQEDPHILSAADPQDNRDLPPPSPVMHLRRGNARNPGDEALPGAAAQRDPAGRHLEPTLETEPEQ